MGTRRQFVVAGAALALAGCSGARGTRPSSSDVVSTEGVAQTDWETASPGSHGIPSLTVEEVLGAGADVPGLRSLLVVRNGVLIGERYYRGASPSDLLPIASVTKSISSMLVGLALERGTIASLKEPVARLLPRAAAQVPDSPVANLTLEEILTGHSGLAFDIFKANELANSPDPVRLAMSLPRTPPPPSGWTYNDPVVGLLSPILAHAEGRDLAAVAMRDLFTPLGIERFAWRRDRQRNPLSYAGLAMRTRDLAKVAWAMTDSGVWRGKQVLPRHWVAQSTRAYGPADWRVPPVENVRYGYLWFTGSLSGRHVVWGWGYGGQFALFAPELRLAVATAATSPLRENLAHQTNSIMALVARLVLAAT